MLTVSIINKSVAKVYKISVENLSLKKSKKDIREARNMAMYKCRTRLKLSYPKIAALYQLKNHQTARSDIMSAANLIETDAETRLLSAKIDTEIARIEASIKKRQCYNLHYRLRAKNITVDGKGKTVSITPEESQKLNKGQINKLLRRHSYGVQYRLYE